MISFDVETDPAFLDSLEDLGQQIADAVIYELFEVASKLSWRDFCAAYQWREHVRLPVETYPGAVEYYRFVVHLPQASPREHVDIFAISYGQNLVLCAVAQ